MKKTILVVDDEFEVAHAVETILEDEGFEVLCAGDGLEAQKVLKEKIPDLIITDIMMPNCNGYQLLETIRKTDDYKNVPVVLMSAAQIKNSAARPQGFLKKPFNLDNLLETVEKIIGKGSS